jgi:hypothetical protein
MNGRNPAVVFFLFSHLDSDTGGPETWATQTMQAAG